MLRVAFVGVLVVALGGGACSKKKKAPTKRSSGPAEIVPAAAKEAEAKADLNRTHRKQWLSQVLGLSTCFWIVRDVTRADRYLADVLESRRPSGRALTMTPHHYVFDCPGVGQRLAPEDKVHVEAIVELSKKLQIVGERAKAYIAEKDYIEDNYVALEKHGAAWKLLVAKLDSPVAHLRQLLVTERAKLRKALEPDLQDDNTRARAIEIVLVTLEVEEQLALQPQRLDEALEAKIARLSELREGLRSAYERPPPAVFEALSGILAALKQVRRDLEPERAKLGLDERERPISEFYVRALQLFRAIRQYVFA